jgi:hypothetical protein
MQSDVEKEDREEKSKPIGYGKADKKKDNFKETSHANNETEKQK